MNKLNEFYRLRTDFTIIGLTGRVGAGCSLIASKLADEDFVLKALNEKDSRPAYSSERIKYDICSNFLKYPGNWRKFQIINYKNVLVLHLIHQANTTTDPIDSIIEIICQNGQGKMHRGKPIKNRFDKIVDSDLMDQLRIFLKENAQIITAEKNNFHLDNKPLHIVIKEKRNYSDLYSYFFGEFEILCKQFYDKLNEYDLTKRSRLTHDLAYYLRQHGDVNNTGVVDMSCMFTIAETLNQLIKAFRKRPGGKTTKIVIDAMKNSLELMYFKEKYSAFYAVATNKNDLLRQRYVLEKAIQQYPSSDKKNTDSKAHKHSAHLLMLDDIEYKTTDHKSGEFYAPDIENCIQKSDYHIYIPDGIDIEADPEEFSYMSLDEQLIKMISLIHQPGIITPTAIERCMQLAFAAKTNSGCISRQVGAAITDKDYSIKAIGWNEVPEGQVPCNLRSLTNLAGTQTESFFSDFEKFGGDYDGKTFKEKAGNEIKNGDLSNLNGRHCPFCFKSFHNAFEGKDNQVHTRSLHAEENAMMQIVKYGGQPVKGGNLFTTASPCELCSKKAFQLGIKNIFYIDPYPGISQTQILKAGKRKESNPKLFMYQGAVGRAFHKLYEPFMSIKDEMVLLTEINPKIKKSTVDDFDVEERIKSLIKDEKKQKELLEKLKNVPEEKKQTEFEKLFLNNQSL